METNLIRDRLHESTKPFVFRLSDGTRIPVVHPDFVAVAPGLVVVIDRKGGLIRIDPMHIVAVEERKEKRSRQGKA